MAEPVLTPRQPRLLGPTQWAAIVVMVLAVGVGGWMGVRLVSQAVGQLRATSYDTPMDRTMHLSSGRWTVYEHTGSQTGGPGLTFTENGPPDLAPGDVTVQDPSGASIPTFVDDRNETINRSGAIYTGAVAFQVATSGSYQIIVQRTGTQVIVARSLFDGLGSSIVTAVLCGLLFLAAGAVLVVSLVIRARRRRRLSPPYPPGPYPPAPPPGSWGSAPPGPWPGPPAPGWGAPPPPPA